MVFVLWKTRNLYAITVRSSCDFVGGETPVPSSTNVISAADFSTSTSDALTTDIKPSLDNNDFMGANQFVV